MNELAIILGFIGLIAGAWLFGFKGAINGGLLGFLLGAVIDLRDRVRKLEQEKADKKKSASTPPPVIIHDKTDRDEPLMKRSELEVASEVSEEPIPETADNLEPGSMIFSESSADAKKEKFSEKKAYEKEPTTSPFERKITLLVAYIRDFFTTGNVVVKVGVIILFFGVAFLLKYASDHGILPIEARLCGVAVSGIVLISLGWKMIGDRKNFGLTLQGGGIGIVYLTVFSAVKLYALIPPFLALCLLVSFVMLTAFMAVVQDAKSLAVLASAGGFLAPVLISSGGGSHVMLFSYYLLLNTGVLGISWFKSWRELNLTGFAFTFVISAIWGLNYYQPEFFETTEPFLIVFFLMYASISVLSALRQPPNLKGYVDGPLVFGLPLVAFALQCGLVKHFEYGIALSSLFLATYYVVIAVWLWKKGFEGIRMLTEAFLAVGVVFATLAIPFAFDRQWIAASWALEGASMVWIGLRQKRCIARTFGLFLQVCAGFTLLTGPYRSPGEYFVLNTVCFNNIIMAFAGLFSGFFYHYYSDRLYRWERWFHGLAAFWGSIWWLVGGLSEIDRHILYKNRGPARLIFIALTSAAFTALRRPLDWSALAVPPVILMPWMLFHFFGDMFRGITHPFSGTGFIAWVSAALSHFFVLHSLGKGWKKKVSYLWHMTGFVILVILLSWEAAYYTDQLVNGSDAWGIAGWLGVPGIVILLLIRFGQYLEWPADEFKGAYLSGGCTMIGLFLCAGFLFACTNDGDPSPLSYIPFVNPSDIIQFFVVFVFFLWARAISVDRMPVPWFPVFRPSALNIVSCFLFFLLLNTVVARCVHVWAGVYYSLHSLYHSFVFQASISILWTLTALCLMPLASRKGIRKLWFVGAWILCGVVIKLFFVDLGGRGTGERIISFIAVGALMLVIGYLSPLPPASAKDEVNIGS